MVVSSNTLIYTPHTISVNYYKSKYRVYLSRLLIRRALL